MGLDATSPLTGSCSARVGVCVVVGASRISHRTTALSGPRTASSITLPHNPCKRGGIAPWRVVRPFRSRDRVLVTLVKRYLITYQKPKRQVRVRTGPGGDGSRCGAVMLWLAVCRVCGRPVCVSHAAESGPGLHGPQKPPAEQAREKTKPKQTGGGGLNLSCHHVRKIVHQPSLWRPARPRKVGVASPDFLRLMYFVCNYIPSPCQWGKRTESAWLLAWFVVDFAHLTSSPDSGQT